MIALLFTTLALVAQEPSPAECTTVENTLQMDECFAALLQAEQARLDAYYVAANDTLFEEGAEDGGDQAIEELRASQTTWTTYAEEACRAVYTRWQGGTIRVVKALICQRDLTRERTHHLWREYLADGGSDSLALPEPVDYAAAAPQGD